MSKKPRQKKVLSKPKSDQLKLGDIHIQKTIDRQSIYRRPASRTPGLKHGYGIMYYWFLLFELNERLPKHKKMTDEEIKRQIQKEYPDSPGAIALGEIGKPGRNGITVNFYRNLYNNGNLINQDIPPVPSRRYGVDGEIVDPRTGRKMMT